MLYKALAHWSSKKISLIGKYQICSKVLASTHVYYSSCWTPFKSCYKKLEKLLRDILWAKDVIEKGFHRVAWEIYYLPKSYGEMGLFDYQK